VDEAAQDLGEAVGLGTPRQAKNAGDDRQGRKNILTVANRDRMQMLSEQSEQDQPDAQQKRSQLPRHSQDPAFLPPLEQSDRAGR